MLGAFYHQKYVCSLFKCRVWNKFGSMTTSLPFMRFQIGVNRYKLSNPSVVRSRAQADMLIEHEFFNPVSSSITPPA